MKNYEALRFVINGSLALGLEVYLLETQDEVTAYINSEINVVRSSISDHIISFPIPCELPIYCSLCKSAKSAKVSAHHAHITSGGAVQLALSETVSCAGCGQNSRIRFACDLVDLAQAHAESRIYITEQVTKLYQKLESRYKNVKGSEFLGFDKQSGVTYSGVRHEDITSLSFDDNSFDFVISLDVLEHVDDPFAGILELHRVLDVWGHWYNNISLFPPCKNYQEK